MIVPKTKLVQLIRVVPAFLVFHTAVQLEQNHSAYSLAQARDSSARFKTTNKQFSYSKTTLLTVQLKPVTV